LDQIAKKIMHSEYISVQPMFRSKKSENVAYTGRLNLNGITLLLISSAVILQNPSVTILILR